MITLLVFQLAVLLFSVILHEISHGYVAEYLGDPTARNAGRLTLNPISHLDPVGSLLVPIGLWLLTGGQFVFGWAKPVPYNPMNLRDPVAGAAKIAAAGPLVNLGLALVFGTLLRLLAVVSSAPPLLGEMFALVVYLNILLAIFNLVPIPPLDGSKVLFAVLPKNEIGFRIMQTLERYGMVLVLLFVFFGFNLIIPLINVLFALITGQPAGF
ncbi:MAG TPA: site-2 protease family protein [Candidatus Paceibacterota bacterium]|nr:site-2 protease family protein [Candidatus Paceibacterota bacterium]